MTRASRGVALAQDAGVEAVLRREGAERGRADR